ncbi:MAG: hypothetical protein KDA31_07340 [Phycisphaerales bacterium]|nr:hypothetical protein [Phycisphaerales bacterium]
MLATNTDRLLDDWAEVGVRTGGAPSGRTPDLERLLVETARHAPEDARLLQCGATWLVTFGQFVARRRLLRLVTDELNPEIQAILGLAIDEAMQRGAPLELRSLRDTWRPLGDPVPLLYAQREQRALWANAEQNASDHSRHWGVYAPPIEFRPDDVRPPGWLVSRHPSYRDRIVRRGDVRASIIESLRFDAPGQRVSSEAEIARLCGANPATAQRALRALELEGVVCFGEAPKGNAFSVRLRPQT